MQKRRALEERILTVTAPRSKKGKSEFNARHECDSEGGCCDSARCLFMRDYRWGTRTFSGACLSR